MGAWGAGAFDNDVAMDWLEELARGQSSISYVLTSTHAGEHGDCHEPEVVVAALALWYHSQGLDDRGCKLEVPQAAAKLAREMDGVDVGVIRAAVAFVGASDLPELWSGDADWNAMMERFANSVGISWADAVRPKSLSRLSLAPVDDQEDPATGLYGDVTEEDLRKMNAEFEVNADREWERMMAIAKSELKKMGKKMGERLTEAERRELEGRLERADSEADDAN
jgi:hypothetical protein